MIRTLNRRGKKDYYSTLSVRFKLYDPKYRMSRGKDMYNQNNNK